MKKFIIPTPAKLEQVPISDVRGAQWTPDEIKNLKAIEAKPLVFNTIQSNMTPDKIRQAKSKQALLASGGKRVSVNLSGQAVIDLEAISARDGTDGSHSIAAALRAFAPR